MAGIKVYGIWPGPPDAHCRILPGLDEYPKYMSDDEESDSPQHCAAGEDCLECEILPSGHKIGALLSTNLTSDGVEYVKEQVQEGGEVAEFWREKFSWIDFPDKSEDEEE